MTSRSTTRLFVAYAAVYLIWGSTYLGVRYAIEALPPFLMSGIRFLIAGGILYAWMRARGVPRPMPAAWRTGLVSGALVVGVGFGVFAWGQYFVSSSVAAIIAATLPFWLVLIDWTVYRAEPPRLRVGIGIALGVAGIALLVTTGGAAAAPNPRGSTLIGIGALLAASICYALGSLISRHSGTRNSPLMGAALQMLTGGALMLIAGLAFGEWPALRQALVQPADAWVSWMALVYLTLFGAVIAYGAYIWLLAHDTPARVSTYAYVNPVIAMLLGWSIGGERITLPMMAGAAIILVGVALITLRARTPRIAPEISTDVAFDPPRA